MPVVRLVNPHSFRGSKRRRGASREHMLRIARLRNAGRPPGKASLSEKIAAVVKAAMEKNSVENPRRREVEIEMAKRRHHKRHHHRNPFASRTSRRGRRRRNPLLSMPTGDLLKVGLWAIGGGVVTRVVPQQFLGANNTGVMGYAANAATGVAASWLASKFAGDKAGQGVLIGSFVALGSRIVSDLFGPSSLLGGGLNGDLAYDLGFYINNSFPLPTSGSGPYLLNSGYSGSPSMNGGMMSAPAVVASNGQPATAAQVGAAAGTPSTASAADGGGGWRGGGRWAA
jgi:hypothetical protein